MIRKYVTINEAMKICGVSRRTIYNWIYEGSIDIRRTPSGMPRLDQTKLLAKYKRRQIHEENLNGRSRTLKTLEEDGRDYNKKES